MVNFQAKSLCILGRQPKLGIAELESLYGGDHVRQLGDCALLDIAVPEMNFRRLGGTIKLAQILITLPTTNWQEILKYLMEKIPDHMQYQPTGKFTLGLSIYNLPVNIKDQTKGLMAIKRAIRSSGKSVRVVPNKELALNSAQVLHNKLTTKGAWELILIKYGQNTILAQSIFVQDINEYTKRDRFRPKRDARVGMLPPKLAQIMINLSNPPENKAVLDPFCGTGVVLQEALLMGFNTIGTDADARMVLFSKENIKWLKNECGEKATGTTVIERGDAQNHTWSGDISAVASEIYLGPPLHNLPTTEKLHKIAQEVDNLLKSFLKNLSTQLQPKTKLCLAVPAWKTKSGFVHLPTLDNLANLGYNQLDFKRVKPSDLIYFREDQIVARQLVVLEKK